MSSNTTHPSLSVSVNVNGTLYPVESYTVGPDSTYNYDTKDYVPCDPILDTTVTIDTLHKLVAGDFALLNNLTTYDERGERTRILSIAVSPTLTVKAHVPRKADIDCPKCNQLFYTDQLTEKWDTAKDVLGKDHYGKVCKACYSEYLAEKAMPATPTAVQSDTPNLHFKLYRCADCGGVVDKDNLNIGQDGTGRCEECDTLYKQANS